jgi:hypothetical protein
MNMHIKSGQQWANLYGATERVRHILQEQRYFLLLLRRDLLLRGPSDEVLALFKSYGQCCMVRVGTSATTDWRFGPCVWRKHDSMGNQKGIQKNSARNHSTFSKPSPCRIFTANRNSSRSICMCERR